jgi:hypothetical protein
MRSWLKHYLIDFMFGIRNTPLENSKCFPPSQKVFRYWMLCVGRTVKQSSQSWIESNWIRNHTSELSKNEFYDRMTVHRNRILVNKTNRCTEFQFYWYYYSMFRAVFLPHIGFGTLYVVVMTVCYQEYDGNAVPAYSWWTERLPETCGVIIPIKLEFSASVGFIHKESKNVFFST